MKLKLLIITLALNTSIYANETLWVTPSEDACKSKSGQIISKGVCKAKWEDAKNICAASRARLPTIDELQQAVKNCKEIAKKAKWEDAKNICAASIAKLSTIDELQQAVKNCKDIAKDDKDKYNACYIKDGFVGTSSYWSSTTHEKFSTSAWGMNFYSAVKANGSKNNQVDVRCVKLK